MCICLFLTLYRAFRPSFPFFFLCLRSLLPSEKLDDEDESFGSLSGNGGCVRGSASSEVCSLSSAMKFKTGPLKPLPLSRSVAGHNLLFAPPLNSKECAAGRQGVVSLTNTLSNDVLDP